MPPSGIYQILNRVNGKRYIGSATDLSNRRSRHFSMLREGVHPNPILQNSFNKHGKDVFIFEELFYVLPENLTLVEQYILDNEHPEYNILKFADSSRGHRASIETRQKMSATHKERKSGGMFNSKNRRKGVESQRKNGTGLFDPNVRHKMISKSIEANRRNGTAVFDTEVRLRGLATQRKKGIGFFNPKTLALGNHTKWHTNRGLSNPNCIWCQEKQI